jgi:hypothetical protein
MPADTTPTNQQPTLRDCFAMHATERDLERFPDFGWSHNDGEGSPIYYTYTREQRRYQFADAMLKAREAKL